MLVAKLKDLIENKKLELVELVNKHGFSHTKVLYLSQEIDNLINKYMIIKKEPYNSRVQREQIHKINKENNFII
ncbi:aspartyl-phosphate phosphatase Spo0E family protein [Bacillus cereus]